MFKIDYMNSASQKKLVLEMGANDLEKYIRKEWIKSGKNATLFVIMHPYIKIAIDSYKQMSNGENLLRNISEEFSNQLEYATYR